ncbi:hypothetical protein IAI18_15135 [Acetobacteraceae bacterium H6797]|nr:hypothetical protein [Acetobacteraceae bacterium H6797]
MRRAALALGAALLTSLPALAQNAPVTVRVGDHPGLGRVVFDLAAADRYQVEQREGQVVLRFNRAIDTSAIRRPPRNVLAVAAVDGGASIAIQPGSKPRVFKLGSRLVVDVADPAQIAEAAAKPREAAREASRETPRATAQRAPGPEASRPPNRRAAQQAASAQTPAAPPVPAGAPPTPPAMQATATRHAMPAVLTTPAMPAVATAPAPKPVTIEELPAPGSILVRIANPANPTAGQTRSLAVAWPEDTGAAILRRGDWLVIVFDRAADLDLTRLRRDPIFQGAEAERLADATVLRLPIASPAVLLPRREGNAWSFEPARDQGLNRSIALEPEAGPPARLALRATAPGRSVAITDPETGLPLLIGTVGVAGQGVPLLRRMPQADLLPTMLGTAVLARSDRLTLSLATDRFMLAGGQAGLKFGASLGDLPSAEAAAMSRVFDFPDLPVPALEERLKAQRNSIAATPQLARGALRREAASTLLALGLPQEAQSMLEIGQREDPFLNREPQAIALRAIAALLAGRLAEAKPLEEAELPASDETALWLALAKASRGQGAEAAPLIAAALPLLRTYPDPLLRRLTPIAAEALVEGNELNAAHRLLDGDAQNTALDYARARLFQRENKPAEALALYDSVSRGRDRLQRAKALRQAIDLRYATGEFDAARAAAAMEATLYAWRGDGEEIETRQRLAELRAAAGDFRGAMDILREAMAMAPDKAEAIKPLSQRHLIAAINTEPPLSAVALYDANRQSLPEEGRSEELVTLLADRLAALDLNDRAIALLTEALAKARPGAAPRLATNLARLKLQEGDAAGALALLPQPEDDSLPEALKKERATLAARAEARRGDLAAARARLAPLGPDGLPILAELQAGAQDWLAAAASLGGLLPALPAAPAPLGEADRLTLVRLAAFAALGGDQARLASLRTAFAPRFQGGELAEAFLLLTAEGLRGLNDLPRLQQELDILRQLPRRLEPLRTAGLAAG